jgi:hypothetical protein
MESSMIDDLMSNVAPNLRVSIEDLLRRPASSREHLVADLDAHTRRIDDAARRRPELDVNLAEAILQACRTLLGDGWADLPRDQQRLVQLVCDYYTDPDDADGDLESVFGFDDDAEVLNTVLEALRRSDLQVRI